MRARVDVDGLVARGLDRYRAGDIDGALAIWETALAQAPDDPRALGYVDYVRQNYDELAGGSGSPMSEQLIPFGLAQSDDDEYEISITEHDGETADASTGNHRVVGGTPERAPEPAIDDGWGLDPDNEPTWFAGAARRALGYAATAFDDDRTDDRTIERGLPPPPPVPVPAPGRALSPEFDFSSSELTGERTIERAPLGGHKALGAEVLRGLGIAPVAPLEPLAHHRRAASEDMTSDGWRPAAELDLADPLGESSGDPSDPRTATADLTFDRGGPDAPMIEPLPPPEFEERGTADLKVKRGGTNPGSLPRPGDPDDRSSVEVEDLLLPPPPSKHKQVDDVDSRDDRPDSRAFTADEAVTAQLSQDIDADAPLLETHDERARRRIIALLGRASSAATSGDHAIAVAAIDLALSEAPDVAAAQKLVHRSRDMILDVYYRFFGDLQKMPILAAPLSELTRRPLDPRAAFLLSRIDGTLTYEEILDVAGMGRLEACRHLAHLLWRGIIRSS
jgi:hypothetical protein